MLEQGQECQIRNPVGTDEYNWLALPPAEFAHAQFDVEHSLVPYLSLPFRSKYSDIREREAEIGEIRYALRRYGWGLFLQAFLGFEGLGVEPGAKLPHPDMGHPLTQKIIGVE